MVNQEAQPFVFKSFHIELRNLRLL